MKIGNYIGSVLASSEIDCGYELRSCQSKEYTIGICCFSAKNAKTGWLRIRIMCPSGATYLPNDCC